MTPKPRILAVITARGGSKRIPGKNIRPISGKPLLAWTIEAALGCKHPLHAVVLSTDNADIAAVGRRYGADVPFLRPDNLATDASRSLPAVQHAVEFIEARDGVRMDWVMILQPTSPLRLPKNIDEAIALTENADCDSIVAVTEMATHPVYAKKIDAEGLLSPFVLEEPEGLRRQDVGPPAYVRNGALYLTRRDILMDQNSLYGKRCRAYVMPPERSIDIDTEFDFRFAEFLLEQK
jgi:CMP-N,N'-diacetyllegionaminic acid synthase